MRDLHYWNREWSWRAEREKAKRLGHVRVGGWCMDGLGQETLWYRGPRVGSEDKTRLWKAIRITTRFGALLAWPVKEIWLQKGTRARAAGL